MPGPKEVVALLTSEENRYLAFCDGCIAKELSIDKRRVATITQTLALTCEYKRFHGACVRTDCSYREKQVTARRGRRKRPHKKVACKAPRKGNTGSRARNGPGLCPSGEGAIHPPSLPQRLRCVPRLVRGKAAFSPPGDARLGGGVSGDASRTRH